MPTNQILNLEIELGDGGREHTLVKLICAGILLERGYDVSSGREYLDDVGVNPDLVATRIEKITSEKGKKRKCKFEYWVEIIDSSDRHLENNEVIKGITDIIKIDIRNLKTNKPFNFIVDGLEYRLPE
ncbi:MAG: hypothetical protein ACXADO_00565 [Candidatus Thorarchaeota archaeon]|jgi:hypothetical protein